MSVSMERESVRFASGGTECAARAARRAPRGTLVRLPGGHYQPFLDGHEQAAEAGLSFLRGHLLDQAHTGSPAAAGHAQR
jgi:hypothetical protein